MRAHIVHNRQGRGGERSIADDLCRIDWNRLKLRRRRVDRGCEPGCGSLRPWLPREVACGDFPCLQIEHRTTRRVSTWRRGRALLQHAVLNHHLSEDDVDSQIELRDGLPR